MGLGAETWVVKLGGAVLEAEPVLQALAEDVRAIQGERVALVLVHGGGPQITAMAERLGIPTRRVGGLRVTDAETMEVTEMVLRGRIAPYLVGGLLRQGIPAVGVSGRDAGLIRARYHPPVSAPEGTVSLGRVGEVERVDPRLLWLLLGAGYLPVVSPVGAGPSGEALNLNADVAAAALAVALQAQRLLLCTDVPGVRDEEGRLLPRLTQAQAEQLLDRGTVAAGMAPKVRAGFLARRQGVPQVVILDGSQGRILAALRAGEGTYLEP